MLQTHQHISQCSNTQQCVTLQHKSSTPTNRYLNAVTHSNVSHCNTKLHTHQHISQCSNTQQCVALQHKSSTPTNTYLNAVTHSNVSHCNTKAPHPPTDISMQFSHAVYFQSNPNSIQHNPATLPSVR